MKILHISDLHIGKIVNGFSMIPEQRYVFDQIYRYIDEEEPDVLLIAGDVYDRTIPGVEAVGLFDDFLTEVAGKNIAILLIAGNHDSPERLSYAGRILSARGIHLCGAYTGSLSSICIEDAFGEVCFWLLPFVKPSTVRIYHPDREVDSYSDAIAAVLDGATRDSSCRHVLLSHQFYTKTGVQAERSESEMSPVGGLDAVDAELLADFDYVALGHLHGAQNVGERVRYAGSPVKYSFSECRQQKSVTEVILGAKGDLTIRALPLEPLHDMREIRGPLEDLIREDVVALQDREDYLRVILTDEVEVADPMGKLRSVYPNIMAFSYDNSRTRWDSAYNAPETDRVETLSPYELFQEFYREINGSVMSESQAALISELLEGSANVAEGDG